MIPILKPPHILRPPKTEIRWGEELESMHKNHSHTHATPSPCDCWWWWQWWWLWSGILCCRGACKRMPWITGFDGDKLTTLCGVLEHELGVLCANATLLENIHGHVLVGRFTHCRLWKAKFPAECGTLHNGDYHCAYHIACYDPNYIVENLTCLSLFDCKLIDMTFCTQPLHCDRKIPYSEYG